MASRGPVALERWRCVSGHTPLNPQRFDSRPQMNSASVAGSPVVVYADDQIACKPWLGRSLANAVTASENLSVSLVDVVRSMRSALRSASSLISSFS